MKSRTENAVLVVNDSPEQLSLMNVLLRRAGYKVHVARDGREGFEVAKRELPDLVISDVVMPGGDGIELCRNLRSHTELRTVPILLVSGVRFDTESVVDGLRAGADDYLEMPFEGVHLIAKVTRLIERAHLEAHYRDIVEQASDMIYTHDMRGMITSINAAGAGLLNKTQGELVGTSFGVALGLDDPDTRLREIIEALEKNERLREQLDITDGEGVRRSLDFSLSMIYDRTGEGIGVRGVARDVTERVEASQRLEELFERLKRGKREWEQTFDAMQDAVLLYDLQHRILRVNIASEAFMDPIKVQQAIGQNWCPFPHGKADSVCPVEQTMTTGELSSANIFGQGKEGDLIYSLSASPLVAANGEIIGAVAVCRDVTEEHRRLEREAESEKMRSLGQLAAGVAHDFNNALAVILGRTQLLLKRSNDDSFRKGLQVIETAAMDAAETVRRIQTFAARDPRNQLSRVSVARLVYDAIYLTRTRWEDDAQVRGINYKVNFKRTSNSEDEIEANPSEVREVFVNLIFNALDAMPQGGEINMVERTTRDTVLVEIRDTGHGIPAAIKDRIFEPFFTTKGPQGSGLGLAVSYGIVNRYGGNLEVESEVGQGTTFTVKFPLSVGAPTAITETCRVKIPSYKVLVVDDEDVVREVLVEMLHELEQDVTEVGSGSGALQLLGAEQFDLLITDLSMPSLDGLTLACRARERAPDMKIMLTTGYGQNVPSSVTDGRVDLVIAKPFQVSDLGAALITLLAEQRAQRS
jgi:PAS domain S-box-containing protein